MMKKINALLITLLFFDESIFMQLLMQMDYDALIEITVHKWIARQDRLWRAKGEEKEKEFLHKAPLLRPFNP